MLELTLRFLLGSWSRVTPVEEPTSARIESIHYVNLTKRTLVLRTNTQASGSHLWITVAEPGVRSHRRRLPITGRDARGRTLVEVEVERGDVFTDRLAFRSRAGDTLRLG